MTKVYHRSSPLGHSRPPEVLGASALKWPASGCQGHSSLCSSAPGPLGALVRPLACARDLPSGSIRLVSAQRARGSAPAPRPLARDAGPSTRFMFGLLAAVGHQGMIVGHVSVRHLMTLLAAFPRFLWKTMSVSRKPSKATRGAACTSASPSTVPTGVSWKSVRTTRGRINGNCSSPPPAYRGRKAKTSCDDSAMRFAAFPGTTTTSCSKSDCTGRCPCGGLKGY